MLNISYTADAMDRLGLRGDVHVLMIRACCLTSNRDSTAAVSAGIGGSLSGKIVNFPLTSTNSASWSKERATQRAVLPFTGYECMEVGDYSFFLLKDNSSCPHELKLVIHVTLVDPLRYNRLCMDVEGRGWVAQEESKAASVLVALVTMQEFKEVPGAGGKAISCNHNKKAYIVPSLGEATWRGAEST
eukprot:1381886-Amphidinium_carterae.1